MGNCHGFRRIVVVSAVSTFLFTGCAGPFSKLARRSNPRLPSEVSDRELQEQTADLTDRQKAEVQLAFARSIERQGDLRRAKSAYLKIIAEQPKLAEAHHRLAVVYDRLGDFDKSAERFRTALKLKPGDADLFCDLGYSLYRQHRWAEAEMNLKQAIAVEPDHARAHNNLGLLMAHTSRFAEAIASFEAAGCTPAALHMNMAFVLTLNRHWAAARDEYQRALAEDPSSQKARDRLQELETLIARVAPQSTSTADAVKLTSNEASEPAFQNSDTDAAFADPGEAERSMQSLPESSNAEAIPVTLSEKVAPNIEAAVESLTDPAAGLATIDLNKNESEMPADMR